MAWKTIASPTWVQQQALVARAQAGEPVRDEIILSLQPCIKAMATKHIYNNLHNSHHIECDDLVQEANVAILEALQNALTKEDPCRYLVKVAKRAMIEYYVNGRSDLIKTWHSYQKPLSILSLDVPVQRETETPFADTLSVEVRLEASKSLEEEYASLYSAIEALPEKQRLVVRRYYGLNDAPTPLNEISRMLSPKSPRPANAHYHNKCALAALRTLLAPETSEPCAIGGAR
ncbi:hypothetical protein KDH_31580 [Dictyobacter sp. S3.2.2.5]|uniref:RNA polymerase sigma-70 region 2 domain-containing protein n=1 Tax=Dictyobacter halimunensis TaxID=3026934 RepID=A0ABQ6FPW3_9CHLR|nr:hypothetical protein KDH_31580 [Dictyobacter sp. S3.2.2.5]